MRKAAPWLIAGGAVLALLATRRESWHATPDPSPYWDDWLGDWVYPDPAPDLDRIDAGPRQVPGIMDRVIDWITTPAMPVPDEINFDPRDYQARRNNLAAFLSMIAFAEGTDRLHGYATLFGGGKFDSFADHPAELGWRGLPLPDHQCIAAGFRPGCVSTAAGRYQITRTTWRRLGGKRKYGSFEPDAQDAAAIDLLRENGALPMIEAGKFYDAVARVRRVWASLPGAGYLQPEKDLATIAQVYAANGGSFA